MVKMKLENKTQLWLGILIAVLSIIYIFTTLGKTEWVTWIAVVFGYFLVIFLFIEGGVYTYFKRKDYRKIGFGDLVVWLTIGASIGLFINTTLLLNIIKEQAPQWIINFSTVTGVSVGIVSGILGIIYIFTSRFK